MSVDARKRLILRNLLQISSHTDTKQRASSGVIVQVTADVWPATPRPRTRGTGAALPFQKRVQRAIGHIAAVRAGSASAPRKTRLATTAVAYTTGDSIPEFNPQRVTLRYRRSSTAHNGVFSGAELLNYGGDNQRKSSSETRTSSSPDDNANTKDRRRDHRPNSRGKRRTSQNNGLVPVERIPREFDPDLPSVLDENISGTRLGIPAHQNKTRTGTRPPALKPLNSAPDQLPSYQVNNPEHRHINPLSISGLAKPNTNTSIDDTSRKAGWTHTQNARVPTVIKPPVISSQLQQNRNNSNSSPAVAASVNTTVTTLQRNTDNSSNGGLSTLAVNASGTGSSTIPRRSYKQNGLSGSGGVSKQVINSQKKTSEEPKYADPISGASSSFQARLSELASLEAETVRFERMRKLKKKNKERDD